jgi:signal transduction histidine kinase
MNAVTILWALTAGAALPLAAVHGFLWLLDRRRLSNLAFGVVAVSVAGYSVIELGMMSASSPAEYGEWIRWFHLANFFAIVGLLAFIQLEFRTGRAWLAWTLVALRTEIVVTNFLVSPNVTWSEITRIDRIAFLGEPVSVVGAGVVRPAQWVGTLASLLFIAYVTDAFVTAWRSGARGTRRKALVVIGGTLAFILVAILEAQLVVWNVVRMPLVVAPPFLILVAAVTYELSRDILASARAAREVQRLRDDLARVGRVNMLSQLSGSLAHDLNQPLTSILANAQAAQKMVEAERADPQELRAILADIVTAERRAGAIIERTRSLIKGESFELRSVSLAEIVKDVLALLRTDAMRHAVALESSLPDSLPPVRGDRVQLSQVLVNLLVNALEAALSAPPGRRRVTIAARPTDEGAVEVAVVDSGSGIPADMLARVFEAFVTTKSSGLGIGLAVSRAIVEAHGGRLWAQNNAGSGATFRFTLQRYV